MSELVIDPNTPIGRTLANAATARKIIFFAGLPGTGKSLYLQQQAVLAHRAGRQVHLMQWDTARAPFETDEMLRKYPEIAGVTHPMIRKAVGSWARGALANWAQAHPNDDHILIGELPVVGNRFSELLHCSPDAAEPLLSSDSCLFLLPIPSRALRQHIEGARELTIHAPRHDRESRDAPPSVVKAHWETVQKLAQQLDLAPTRNTTGYDPDSYRALFLYLLQNRHSQCLEADQVWPTVGSVYDLDVSVLELLATPDQVAQAYALVSRQYPGAQCQIAVDKWYEVASNE